MLILDKITVSSANLAPLWTRSMDFNTRMPHSVCEARRCFCIFGDCLLTKPTKYGRRNLIETTPSLVPYVTVSASVILIARKIRTSVRLFINAQQKSC